MDMHVGDKIKQTQEELRAKGVKYCIGAYVDIHGVPKGKVVPIAHLDHMAHGSERYTGYALDGLGQAPNDDEIRLGARSRPHHPIAVGAQDRLDARRHHFQGQTLSAEHARCV